MHNRDNLGGSTTGSLTKGCLAIEEEEFDHGLAMDAKAVEGRVFDHDLNTDVKAVDGRVLDHEWDVLHHLMALERKDDCLYY